jgi:hypothetical protein
LVLAWLLALLAVVSPGRLVQLGRFGFVEVRCGSFRSRLENGRKSKKSRGFPVGARVSWGRGDGASNSAKKKSEKIVKNGRNGVSSRHTMVVLRDN